MHYQVFAIHYTFEPHWSYLGLGGGAGPRLFRKYCAPIKLCNKYNVNDVVQCSGAWVEDSRKIECIFIRFLLVNSSWHDAGVLMSSMQQKINSKNVVDNSKCSKQNIDLIGDSKKIIPWGNQHVSMWSLLT